MPDILGSPNLGHEGEVPTFPGDNGGTTGTPTTIDIGNGLVAVMGADGSFLGIERAPATPTGPFTGITEGERQAIAQADRQLAATIKNNEANLAELRRQFDISSGQERERLAAEIRIAERELQSSRQIATMDARTRLTIARMADLTTRRGQGLDLATRRAQLGARKAEFAAGALGNDAVRQAIFLLGGSGGTSPLEAAAQTFPTLDFEFGTPEVPGLDIGALTKLPGLAGGGVVGPGQAVEVGEGKGHEIVINRGDGTMMVIPIAEHAQEGGTFPLASILGAKEDARKTFSNVLGEAFDAGPQPAFGGIGQEMESLFGVDLKLPSQLAAVFPRLPNAVQNIIRQALAVRGINPTEFRRRRLAATPNPVFSGVTGVRP